MKRSFILSAVVLFLVGFLVFSHFGMEMGVGEQMTNCPFMPGQAAMCTMSPLEHIVQWQQAFLGILKGDFLALEALLLAIVLIPFAKPFSKLEKLTELAAQLLAYQKTHLIKVFDPLLLAFSDGILNPRIYEPAHI